MKTRSKATHRDLFTRYIINNIGFFNISVNNTHSNTCIICTWTNNEIVFNSTVDKFLNYKDIK